MGLNTFVAGYRVDTLTNRSVFIQPISHLLQIVLPFNRMKRREMHQDLAVDPQVKEQPDVGLGESTLLFVREVETYERAASISRVPGLKILIAVEFKQKLLHVVQAHRFRF